MTCFCEGGSTFQSDHWDQSFEDWLGEILRVYDPADMDYPAIFAEIICEEMRSAQWKPIRVGK